MEWTEQEWAQWGKALLLLWGVVCFAVCLYDGPGEFQVMVKVWIGLLGVMSVATSLKSLVDR